MTDLFIYKSDNQPFNEEDVYSKLEAIGVSRLRLNTAGDAGTFIEGHFSLDEDSTMVELSDDLETYSTSDDGPAAREFAIRLQSQYEDPLQICDIHYSFHLSLKEYQDALELDQAMLSAELPKIDSDGNPLGNV